MDWINIVILVGIFIAFIVCIVVANKSAKEELEKREIIERILRQNDEYEKMNEKLKKKIKDLQNENKK
jgi:uncharacterized protein YlxW (UPF0749 family)